MSHKTKCLQRAASGRSYVDNILGATKRVPFAAMHPSAITGFPELKNSAGVYMLFHDELLLYIGYSSGLRYRLTNHAKKWISLDPDMFPTHCEVLSCMDLDAAIELESWLIECLKPPLNRTTKKYDKVTDEQKSRTLANVEIGDVFSEYGVLEAETERFYGWFGGFDEALDRCINLNDSGDGSWRVVTPEQYCP